MGFELLWQVRTKVQGGQLITYDINGDVESAVPLSEATYGDPMRSAGVVDIDEEFASWCGPQNVDAVIGAVMRHGAKLLALGYGDSGEEVIEWMRRPWDTDYMHGISYRFVEDCPPFVDLSGVTCRARLDREIILDFTSGGVAMEVELRSNDLVSFLISSSPDL